MEIEIFKNEAFGKMRVIKDENDEPLFCLKDVAVSLGYKKRKGCN
ncbi:MAG: Bro-N domain-containing protein [Flavobacteriales bacterium]|nr:Bro-N domain-containing protein [Flavobacteriales bacterium]